MDAFVAARTSDQDAEVAVTKSLEPYRDAAPGLVGGTRPDGLAHRSGDVPGAVPQGAVAILAGRIMDWGDGDGRPALNSEVAHELAYYLTEVGAVPQEEVVPKVSEEVWMARLSKLVRDDLKSLQEPLPQGVHASDCAVHNEPAYPNGPCNCGAEIIVTAEMIASAFAWEKSGSAVVSDEFYFAALYRAMAAVAPKLCAGDFADLVAERDAAIALADMYQRWFYNATESPEAADAVSPVGKVRDTIQNLRAGVIPRQLVRDLGDAVERAKQDLAVGGMKG